jgi:MarR-like DNA-binding transcriptional regulator SgrR of sgrS sRNA
MRDALTAFILSLIFSSNMLGRVAMANETHIIKTYLSFGLPVDPANVVTLADLDLSYALASTLVDWSDDRKLREGLAKSLSSSNETKVAFQLRPQAKWSDGTPITAKQAVKSFERAKRLYGDTLKSLFELLEKIDAKDERTIVFHLNRAVAASQILHKLTEPMYGVVFVREDGSIDLSKSTGAFSLTNSSEGELTLAANPHWYGHAPGMADKIIIRQEPKARVASEEGGFAGDTWPNLLASTSVMSKDVASLYQREHFSIWNRNLDRVFFLSPSTRLANTEGRELFRALNKQLDREALLKGLSGYHLSQQFFPEGYVIFDPEFKTISGSVETPDKFKQRPLELLAAEGRMGSTLRQNLSDAIKKLTGHAPKIRMVPISEFNKERSAEQFDILVATLAVNDPNVEGAVSFFFGMNPPLIPNSYAAPGNFTKRITEARQFDEGKRNAEYRKVFTQTVQDGCLLPLFHFSSVVIAREGIDLSGIPTSDETVAFSKVRFKR